MPAINLNKLVAARKAMHADAKTDAKKKRLLVNAPGMSYAEHVAKQKAMFSEIYDKL